MWGEEKERRLRVVVGGGVALCWLLKVAPRAVAAGTLDLAARLVDRRHNPFFQPP